MTTDGLFPLPLASALGTSIWTWVQGAVPRRLLATLYARVRTQGTALFVPLRGDTPDCRRLLDLHLQPLEDGAIAHVCDCLWSEPRAVPILFQVDRARSARTLDQCAFCRRIKVRSEWREVEDACLLLRLDRAPVLPSVEQTVCCGCQHTLIHSMAAEVA